MLSALLVAAAVGGSLPGQPVEQYGVASGPDGGITPQIRTVGEARVGDSTFGLRLEYHHAGDDAPFWALPFVKLRGVPAFRYLGNYSVTGEIEPGIPTPTVSPVMPVSASRWLTISQMTETEPA